MAEPPPPRQIWGLGNLSTLWAAKKTNENLTQVRIRPKAAGGRSAGQTTPEVSRAEGGRARRDGHKRDM